MLGGAGKLSRLHVLHMQRHMPRDMQRHPHEAAPAPALNPTLHHLPQNPPPPQLLAPSTIITELLEHLPPAQDPRQQQPGLVQAFAHMLSSSRTDWCARCTGLQRVQPPVAMCLPLLGWRHTAAALDAWHRESMHCTALRVDLARPDL